MSLGSRLGHAFYPAGLMAIVKPARGPRQVTTTVDQGGDDPFLDGLEAQHAHAAQMALSKVTAGDTVGAYRWYIEAAVLASVLVNATGDPIWKLALKSERELATQQDRILRRPVRAVKPSTLDTVVLPTPVDEREKMIRELMAKPHSFTRELAERVTDQALLQPKGQQP